MGPVARVHRKAPRCVSNPFLRQFAPGHDKQRWRPAPHRDLALFRVWLRAPAPRVHDESVTDPTAHGFVPATGLAPPTAPPAPAIAMTESPSAPPSHALLALSALVRQGHVPDATHPRTIQDASSRHQR